MFCSSPSTFSTGAATVSTCCKKMERRKRSSGHKDNTFAFHLTEKMGFWLQAS
jgi:hypothetical protein